MNSVFEQMTNYMEDFWWITFRQTC
jgi:hypothetical protein